MAVYILHYQLRFAKFSWNCYKITLNLLIIEIGQNIDIDFNLYEQFDFNNKTGLKKFIYFMGLSNMSLLMYLNHSIKLSFHFYIFISAI